jgi:hypothetical protein
LHITSSPDVTVQGDEEEPSLFPYGVDYGLSSQSRKLLGRDNYNKYAEYVNVCASNGTTVGTFVKVQNNRLTIDGKKFYFAGWNIWEILEGACDVFERGRASEIEFSWSRSHFQVD